MLSRVAENLYWLGRYLERAENTVRIVDVNSNLLLDLPRGTELGWSPLIAITGSQERFEQAGLDPTERAVVKFIVTNRTNPGSVINSLGYARENARNSRDYLPQESYGRIRELHTHAIETRSRVASKRQRFAYLEHIIGECQGIGGLLMDTMNHDAGYRFLQIGRLLERADMTTRIIDVRSETLLPTTGRPLVPFEQVQWMGVLKSLSAHQMYRRKVNVQLRRAPALEFLLRDDQFPRSVRFCIRSVSRQLELLPTSKRLTRVCDRIEQMLDTVDIITLSDDAIQLGKTMDRLQRYFSEIQALIDHRYFSQDDSSAGGPRLAVA